jgi:hypothetical protein
MKTYEQVRAERAAEAAEYLKDHTYRALSDTPECQVWRCAKPGTSAYAFDIMITRFGIAVVGDIANLTFSVGMGYGMEFLAGNDIGYYIHSKLDEKCKTREFDEPAFRGALISGVCELICQGADDEQLDAMPEWVREEKARGLDGSRWHDLRQFVSAEARKDDADDKWDEWSDLLREASDIGDEHHAGVFMNEHCEVLGLGPDWWEISVTTPSASLIRELYMIRHAARAILAQTQAAAA